MKEEMDSQNLRCIPGVASNEENSQWPTGNSSRKWPIKENDVQIPAISVDIPKMLSDVSQRVYNRRQRMMNEVFNSNLWGSDYSLKHVENFGGKFDAVSGSIKIPSEIPNILLDAFYQDAGRFYAVKSGKYGENEQRYSRGPNYYVAVDSSIDSIGTKIDVIEKDIYDALGCIANISRNDALDPSNYFAYLGVLDLLKQHYLTLFHALTYQERGGTFRESGRPQDIDYRRKKKKLYNLSANFTKAFYATLIGRNYNLPLNSLIPVLKRTNELIGYCRENITETSHFKLQEVDHPLIIMAAAQSAVKEFPDPDLIIGLPSGGTQISFATRFAYQILLKHTPKPAPEIIFVPLSTHSGKAVIEIVLNQTEVEYYLLQKGVNFEGKKVLISEDNTNTATTIKLVVDALKKLGVKEVKVSLCEADLIRIMNKQQIVPHRNFKHQKPGAFIANYLSPSIILPGFIAPIRRGNEQDFQIRKVYAQKVIQSKYVENT